MLDRATARDLEAGQRTAGVLEDWLLAAAFGLFPAFGLVIGAGEALTLTGVAILLWTGHRAPMPEPLRDAARAGGLAALLAVACLLLPMLEHGTSSEPFGWIWAASMRAVLAGVVLASLLRGRLPTDGRATRADKAAVLALALAGVVLLALWLGGESAAFRALAVVAVSLAGLLAIHRMHLVGSQALPALTRSALLGVAGTLAVLAVVAVGSGWGGGGR